MARDRSLLRSLTRSGDIIGTPVCMAPEQIEGRRDVGPPCDVYALGVILYRCLTGRLPHVEKTFAELARSVLERTPTAPRRIDPAIPAHLERACLRALAKDLRNRPSATELADALRAPPSADAPPAPARVVWGAVALAVTLLVGVGLALALRLGGDEPGAPTAPPVAASPPAPSDPPPAPTRDWRDALEEAEDASRQKLAATDVLALLEEAERLAPPEDRAEVVLARAWFRYRRGDHPGALRETDALDVGPDRLEPRVALLRVQVLLAERRLDSAQPQLEWLASEAPSPLSLLARAQLELTRLMTGSGFRSRPTLGQILERIASAKALAREAEAAGAGPLALQVPPFLDLLSASLPQGGASPEEIVAGIRQAIAASPDDLHAHNLLAVAGYSFAVQSPDPIARRRHLETALEGTTDTIAISLDPSTLHLLQHAHVLFLLESYAEARPAFARAQETTRDQDPECRIWLAACDARLGRSEQAEQALRDLQAERPEPLARLLEARRGRIQLDDVADWAKQVLAR